MNAFFLSGCLAVELAGTDARVIHFGLVVLVILIAFALVASVMWVHFLGGKEYLKRQAQKARESVHLFTASLGASQWFYMGKDVYVGGFFSDGVVDDLTCMVTSRELVFVRHHTVGHRGAINADTPVNTYTFDEKGRIPRNSVRTINLENVFGGIRQLNIEWEDDRGLSRKSVFTFPSHRAADDAAKNINLYLLRRMAAQPVSPADELHKLAQLVKDGVLTTEEWTRAKELYLGKPEDKREQTIDTLRKLYKLKLSGVLSAMEFNMKKWDILARRG
jgi:hypothetical protein